MRFSAAVAADRLLPQRIALKARPLPGRVDALLFPPAGRMSLIAFGSQMPMARRMGGNLACLGFHTSLIPLVAEYRENRMLRELRRMPFASRLFTLMFSTALAGLAAACLWALSGWVEPYCVAPSQPGLFCLPMVALGDTLPGLACDHARAVAALSPARLVRPLSTLAFMAGAPVMPIQGPRGAAKATAPSIVFETTSRAVTAWRRLRFVMFVAAPRPS